MAQKSTLAYGSDAVVLIRDSGLLSKKQRRHKFLVAQVVWWDMLKIYPSNTLTLPGVTAALQVCRIRLSK
jgi:hypothetical protein